MHLTHHTSRGRRWMARIGRRERGATSVLVIVLLVPVLFGAAALSIDVGGLMWERRQLQNGSDAAVVRAAQQCAENQSQCPFGATTSLTNLAGANANDSASTVSSICGNAAAQAAYPSSGPPLTLCASASSTPPTNPGITDCPVVPSSLASGVPYIELRTETKTSGGAGFITSRIASIVNGGNVNTTVRSCSRAAWGPAAPSSLTVFPIAMSYCDWAAQTGYTSSNPAVYPPGPVDTITPYGYGAGNPWTGITERTVYTKNNPATCGTWDGHSAPGGFYSLSAGGCQTTSSVNGWVQGTTGNATPCDATSLAGLVGTVIYIPVFDCLQGSATTITPTTDCTGLTGANKATGSNTYYHIGGYAAFYLTGWFFSNSSRTSIKSSVLPCSGGDRCISGWFTKDLISAGDIVPPVPGGPPNLGLNVVKPVG